MDSKNIMLAYRNIKGNKGSKTAGTDKENIDNYRAENADEIIELVRNQLNNYNPKPIRRVEIPKPNGKTRPLGIPCFKDRLIQQCIKQVLEPIAEAKFHKHSYGFRPNRSTKHAIARCKFLVNMNKLHYVVDVDIKSFFDKISHAKLLKQLWTLGINDKQLITIINKMLKCEVAGSGKQTEGTPQGGILSPLLSNIVLNELDWWISDQWETFKSEFPYGKNHHKYEALKRRQLKEIYIVRYADDFKIFCRDKETANKIFYATTKWLNKRLKLDISEEKSKITNLKKGKTEFLGFKLWAEKKRKKYICKSSMTEKAKKQAKENLKKQIKAMQKETNHTQVCKYNSIVLGLQNYYKSATQITTDLADINFDIAKTLHNRIHHTRGRPETCLNYKTYSKVYGGYKGLCNIVGNVALFPIYACKHSKCIQFNQRINNYSKAGRAFIHSQTNSLSLIVQNLIKNTYNLNMEYVDNRISLLYGQNGKCGITGNDLRLGEMECHHIIPKSQNGSDEYKNLIWIEKNIHKLVHATNSETIEKYITNIRKDVKAIKKVNSLRKKLGNSLIEF